MSALDEVTLVACHPGSIIVSRGAGQPDEEFWVARKQEKNLRGALPGDIIRIDVDWDARQGPTAVQVERYTGTILEKLVKQDAAIQLLAACLRHHGTPLPELDLGEVR